MMAMQEEEGERLWLFGRLGDPGAGKELGLSLAR